MSLAPHAVGRGVLARAVAAVAPVTGYQRFLYRVGVLLIAWGLVHLGVFVVDGGGWWGAVSWRKPFSFGVSFGLAALSIGWVLGQLPRRPRLGWAIAGVLGIASTVEVAMVTLQRWRGVPSHFNTGAVFDNAVFGIMGQSVALIGVALVVTFVWAAVERRTDQTVRVAVLTGLLLVLMASGIGSDLISRGTAEVAATGQIPGSVVIGAAGSGKLAHAVGLHGLQVLGALAVVLGLGSLAGRVRLRVMRIAAAAYTGLFAVVVAQAYGGRGVLDLQPLAAAVLAVAVCALAWSGLVALRAVRTAGRTELVGV